MTLWLESGLSAWFSALLLLLVSLLLFACSSVTLTSALKSGLFLPMRCVASPYSRAWPDCNTPWSNWSCLTPVWIYRFNSCSECWSCFGLAAELFFSVLRVCMLDLSIVDYFFELSFVKVLIEVLKWLLGVVYMTRPWWPEPYSRSCLPITLFLVVYWLIPLLFCWKGPAVPIGTEFRFYATFNFLISCGVNSPLSWSRLSIFFAKAYGCDSLLKSPNRDDFASASVFFCISIVFSLLDMLFILAFISLTTRWSSYFFSKVVANYWYNLFLAVRFC